MKIESTRFDTHTVLTLQGDFETEDAPALLDTIEGLRAEGATRVALSLRFVKYVNSTALGSMVRACKSLREDGGELVISRPSSVTREIITNMGLDSVIPLFSDEDAAVQHLTGANVVEPTASAPGTDGEHDEAVALFSFPDERAEMFSGRSKNGVGQVVEVDVRGIAFSWDGPAHGLDAAALETMFRTGSSIHVKFRMKLVRKDYFNVDATVFSAAVDDAGVVTVTAKWAKIPAPDREALALHTKHMNFLRSETGDGE